MAKKTDASITQGTDQTTRVLVLINTTTEAFSKMIAAILGQSGLSADELRKLRDELSLDTSKLIEEELAKLGDGE